MADAPTSGDRLKLFISYSRRDMAAADALVMALECEGFEIAIDRRDLPYGEEWQKELADFIRGSDAVVWLVSPDSVTSKWCNWELGEVGRLNKRLVPVKMRDVAPEELPESLGKVHLLPVDGVYDPVVHLSSLVTTLNTDRGWMKEATRLADRAREWIARERNRGLLLRGPSLNNAEAWSTVRPKAAPPPASEVLELILASRRDASRRHRWAIGGSLAVAAVALSLAGLAYWQREVAVEQRDKARAELLAIQARRADREATSPDDIELAGALALASISKSHEAASPPEGRGNLGEQLTLLDVIADIDVALQHMKASRSPRPSSAAP
jgi:hypothetical protein